jgi:hypothetical protein
VDLFRSRRSLLTEIALLRHQLTALEPSVARPHVTRLDRIVLVALAAADSRRIAQARIRAA